MISYLRWRWRTRRCAHLATVGIYGDRINEVGGYRLRCLDCHKLLDGPVTAATRPTYQRDRFVAPGELIELCAVAADEFGYTCGTLTDGTVLLEKRYGTKD